jgi:ATPase subunit of ABC transporter with duplicated ATPase domains
MSSLHAQGVAFAYSDALPILSDVTFHLGPGWTGLVGENGAGKSTLLQLLAGELVPSEGALRLEPEWAVRQLCPQRVEHLTPEITGFAAATDGLSRRLHGSLRLALSELARWDSLSPGERKRWQIGAALSAEPDLLLLDEPTNHLDSEARAWLLESLRGFRGVGLVVSHDRTLLEALTTKTLRVHRGAVTLWSSSYAVARREWEAAAHTRRETYLRAQDEVRRQERKLDQLRREREAAAAQISTRRRMRNQYDSDARTLGARTLVEWADKSLGRRVKTARHETEQALEAAEQIEWEKTLGRSLFVDYVRPPNPWLFSLDTPVLRRGETDILHDVRVAVGRESRIRIEGPNGAGKTTLLHALLEQSRLPKERILFLPQDLTENDAAEVLREVKALPGQERGRVMSLVAALGVDPDRLLSSESPSPGEARKLLIALGLGRHAWALVMDEPTNHLDLPSIERLEEALQSYPGALLIVSHDESFAKSCTSEVWQVSGGQVITP